MGRHPYTRAAGDRPERLWGAVLWSVIILTLIAVVFCMPAIIDLAMELSEPVTKIMP